MLPYRTNPGPRRTHAIAAEIRVPSSGAAFAALARFVRAEGVFLATFRELPLGTRVIVELALNTGALVVDGVVASPAVPVVGGAVGIAVDFVDVDERARKALADEQIAEQAA